MVGWRQVEEKRTVAYPDVACRVFKLKLVSQSVLCYWNTLLTYHPN